MVAGTRACRGDGRSARRRSSGLRAIESRKLTGFDVTHGGEAAHRRGKANAQRKQELREWEELSGKLTDISAFKREILSAIADVPLSKLQRATGLSLRYVSQIRRGEKTPHPKHWAALVAAAKRGSSGAGVEPTEPWVARPHRF